MLEYLGITYEGKDNLFYIGRFMFLDIGDYYKVCFKGNAGYTQLTNIVYIHQLQNLYFEVTKQELIK